MSIGIGTLEHLDLYEHLNLYVPTLGHLVKRNTKKHSGGHTCYNFSYGLKVVTVVAKYKPEAGPIAKVDLLYFFGPFNVLIV